GCWGREASGRGAWVQMPAWRSTCSSRTACWSFSARDGACSRARASPVTIAGSREMRMSLSSLRTGAGRPSHQPVAVRWDGLGKVTEPPPRSWEVSGRGWREHPLPRVWAALIHPSTLCPWRVTLRRVPSVVPSWKVVNSPSQLCTLLLQPLVEPVVDNLAHVRGKVVFAIWVVGGEFFLCTK